MKEKDNIQLLMEETGCDRSEAEFALSVSGNNLENAITAIGFLLKFITAFKIKLIFPQENVYGLIHIAVNVKTGEILRFSEVFSHNPAVYEISAHLDWFSFEKAIFSARLDAGAMESYTQSIEENFKIYTGQAIKELAAVNAHEIKKITESFFSQKQISIEIIGEELNLTQYKKLPDYPLKQNETSFTGYELGFIKLDADILEDSHGKPARKISEGDTVLSLITDERDIAHYLAHLIGGRKDGIMIPLPATVKKISSKNDDFEIHLNYTPSVTGLAKIKGGAILKVLETKNRAWWKKIMPW